MIFTKLNINSQVTKLPTLKGLFDCFRQVLSVTQSIFNGCRRYRFYFKQFLNNIDHILKFCHKFASARVLLSISKDAPAFYATPHRMNG